MPRLRAVTGDVHASDRGSFAPARAGGAGSPRHRAVTANLQERVNAALATIRNNRLGINVLEAEMVRDVATTLDGKVRFTLLLAPSDEATIVRDVRQVVKQVDGVTDVRVDVKDGSQGPAPGTTKP